MKKIVQLVITLIIASNLFGQTPILLKDINAGTSSSINSYIPGITLYKIQ